MTQFLGIARTSEEETLVLPNSVGEGLGAVLHVDLKTKRHKIEEHQL
jgi:hypothetical protein